MSAEQIDAVVIATVAVRGDKTARRGFQVAVSDVEYDLPDLDVIGILD